MMGGMRRALLVLTATVVAGLGAGCGDDGDSVSDRLGDELEEQVGVEGADVSCPDGAEAERGAVFDCRVSKDGETATIRVSYDTDDHFTFDLAEGEPVPDFILEAVDADLPDRATTTSSTAAPSSTTSSTP